MANNAGTYLSSDWQLSLVSDFMTTVKAASSLASLNWSADNLTPGTTYYVRVRHRSSGGTVSSWGVRAFNTTALGSVTAIAGPDTLMTGQASIYLIEGYQAGMPYLVTSSAGTTFTRFNDAITVTAPASTGPIWIEVNGVRKNINVMLAAPSTPSTTHNIINIDVNGLDVTFSASDFFITSDAEHESSDWYLATDSNFTNIVSSAVEKTVDKTTWSVSDLNFGTTYYVRLRYNATNGASSEFGVHTFTTQSLGTVNALMGPDELPLNQSGEYTIVGYQVGQLFFLTTSAGITATRTENIVTINPSSTVQNAWIEVNGVRKNVLIDYPKPNAPVFNATSFDYDGLNATANFALAGFSMSSGSATHQSTDWEISTSNTFDPVTHTVLASTTDLLTLSHGPYTPGTTYHVRARFTSSQGKKSDWGVATFKPVELGPVFDLSGPAELTAESSANYTIIGYDSTKRYELDFNGAGFASMMGNTVNVSASATPGTLNLIVNGFTKAIPVNAP